MKAWIVIAGVLAAAFAGVSTAAYQTTDKASAKRSERIVGCNVRGIDHRLKVLVLNCEGDVRMFSGPALERLKISEGVFESLYPGSPLFCEQAAKFGGISGRNFAPNGGYRDCNHSSKHPLQRPPRAAASFL